MRNDATLGIVAIAVSACAYTMTPASVRQEIETAIPVGSPSERVIAFLNERGWNDGSPIQPSDIGPASTEGGVLELPTIIRKTHTLWPVSYSITIVFRFDEQRKLRSFDVAEIGTGP